MGSRAVILFVENYVQKKTFLTEKQIQENTSSSYSIIKKHQHSRIKSCSRPAHDVCCL